jgi:hypothetical protein
MFPMLKVAKTCMVIMSTIFAQSMLVQYAGGEAPQAPKANVLEPLPLSAIKPKGWLEQQMKLQLSGLSGHLDEFWPDIKESSWFGGTAEGWERVPYWLDGVIPLAYQLDDAALRGKIDRAVDYILAHQQEDGWLGPVGDNNPRHKPYDVWPLFPLFKALIQYQEASNDERIVPALTKCAKKIDQLITKEPLYSWAHFRAADFVESLYWLHQKTGDEALIEIARKALSQAYDWRAHFEHFEEKYSEKTTQFGLDNHGVNNGMALKFGAMRWRLTGDEADRNLGLLMLEKLDRFHGQPTGMFTCDEHYAGRSPSQGTELCTVVEAMHSLELLCAATSDPQYADRLERLAFNALPATFKKDMTAHQYDQQCNQVVCAREGEHVYVNNGPDSNLFGLEPNFGCCTANLHQGWPKFVSNLWMKTNDGGLAAVGYAPCEVKTQVGDQDVEIEVRTGYPFRNVVIVKVSTKQPATFPLHLRLPYWSDKVHLLFKDSNLTVDGERIDAPEGGTLVTKPGGSMLKVSGDWKGLTTFVIQFEDPVQLYRGANNSAAVVRGPLVFALPIKANWKKVKDRPELPFDDWEVYPASEWTYAIEIDEANPGRSISIEDSGRDDVPFSAQVVGPVARVTARKLATWAMERGAAAPPPASPVSSDSPRVELNLLPYGATDLRITEFPILGPK